MLKPRRNRLLLAFVPLTLALGLARCDAPPEEAPLEAAPVATVPFEMLPSNHMVVEVRINGKGPYRLIFDVGSPVTLLSNRAAKDSGLIDPKARGLILFGAQGEAEVEELQVGALTAEAVPVIVMDHPVVRLLGEALGKPIDGLVGHTFFARYKTTIDYQAETMDFEPVENEVRDIFRDLPQRLAGPKVARRIVLDPGGLWGFAIGDPEGPDASGVPVTSVLEGSPAAEAGLEVGDLLTSLDGRWTLSASDAFEAAAGVSPGESAELVVLRDGEEQTLTVTPRPGI
ncbi:hypothetical protein BH23PLA1_BH23PLA1_26730 [soil metagenome]